MKILHILSAEKVTRYVATVYANGYIRTYNVLVVLYYYKQQHQINNIDNVLFVHDCMYVYTIIHVNM